jgi:UDP-N-acetylmuramate dehydrogenase
MTDVFEEIDRIEGVAARADEMMSLHTSLRVGGPCDLMVWVSNVDALRKVLSLARSHSLPTTVIGKGSNVLVKDGGISGLVVRLVDDFERIDVSQDHLRAGAGASLAEVVSQATSAGIGGLEFLAGIPGTVGGAVTTNAGSKDVWISSRLVEIDVLTDELRELELKPRDLSFDYRYSSIDSRWTVTAVALAGYRCSVEEARQKVEEYLDMRRSTQPAGAPTAGCIFKNPPGDAAGRMIEQVGLKGTTNGGAQVSTIHANWIVNTGGATTGDILGLIAEMRSRVRERYEIELELEIDVIGRD